MAELSRLGQPDQSGWTTLDRIGAAARKAREYISPWNVVSPTDVAGFAPGGGLVQAWQDSGRGLANLKAGNYGQAAADYGSMALNTAGELLPVAKLGMALAPLARLPDGRVQLGAVMKDVDRGGVLGLAKSDMRAMNQAVDAQNWSTVEVPIRSLYATQPYANADFANAANAAKARGDGADLPLVVRAPDGKMYVRDGHHRLTAEADKGAQTARVRLVDLGEKPADHPELPFSQASQGITAYHGSPHDFDRFDMSKIGTGEGAQAYGHGLYFAEAEKVAKGYRDRIAGAEWIDKRGVPQQTNLILEDVVAQLRKDGMGLIDAEENASFWSMVARDGDKVSNLPGYASIKKVLDEKGIKLREKGALYQVRINANPDDFLDWDKPLSEQAAVWKRIAKDWGGEAEAADRLNLNPSVATGQQYMNAVAPQGRGDAFRGLSERLKEQGIPGIKYLDGGSRGAGDGTRNFVVFDDKLVEILKKYGWVPGMAIPAAAMMEYQQQGGSAPQM